MGIILAVPRPLCGHAVSLAHVALLGGVVIRYPVQLRRALLHKLLTRCLGCVQQLGNVIQLHLLRQSLVAVQHILIFLNGLVKGGELIPIFHQRRFMLLAQIRAHFTLV